ncbi:MAG: LysR family transcriptional regulator [Gammaproteobacteria bacterium]|nr:LysR family transcriptional regulator [Gammaproteobacteria bacterium]
MNEKLIAFVAVARLGTVNAAAAQLHLTPAAISARLSRLAEQLSLPLFETVGRKLRLTANGEALLPYAEQVLKAEDVFVTQAHRLLQSPVHKLKFSAPNSIFTYWFPPALMKLTAAMDNVELQYSPMSSSAMLNSLAQDEIDLAVWVGRQPSHRLAHQKIGDAQMVLFAKSGIELPETLDDLARYQLVTTEHECNYCKTIFEQLAQASVSVGSSLHFENVDVVKQCVLQGMGLGWLPRFSIEAELAEGRLTSIELPGVQFEFGIYYVWNPARAHPARDWLLSEAEGDN